MATVAIFGASGFVGATLVERLIKAGSYEVRPIIHNSGNAWRLARHGLELRRVDILSTVEVERALEGCTHVVNCTRGPEEVMLRGLGNLLSVVSRKRLKRFVHISSVAVYEPPFPDRPVDEAFEQKAPRKSYGGIKLQQDRQIEAAARKGLSSVVLCPPNISGPYSAYMAELVDLIRGRQLALIDGGHSICPLIDVENLAYAIERALETEQADGRRVLVTDPDEVSWAHVLESLSALTDLEPPLPEISAEVAGSIAGKTKPPRKSMRRAMGRLISSDVRKALKKDPLWAGWITGSVKLAKKLPRGIQKRLRGSESAAQVVPRCQATDYSSRLLAQQLRGARYDITRAQSVLDYHPPVSSEASLRAFHHWYRAFRGLDTDAAELFQLIG